jgi:hypothetical protein
MSSSTRTRSGATPSAAEAAAAQLQQEGAPPSLTELSNRAVREAASVDSAAVLYAQNMCGFANTTAFAEAFRDGGLEALRRSFNTAMAGPCAALGDTTICSSDRHREQICAEWFMRRGPCGNSLVEFSAQNPQLCAAAQSVAVDYPELSKA